MSTLNAFFFDQFPEDLYKKEDDLDTLIETVKSDTEEVDAVYSQVKIGNSRAKELARVLKHNTTITHLKLKWSGFHDKGGTYLAKSLEHNRCLRILQIVESNIREASAFSEALKRTVFLKALNLNGNKLGDDGAINIASALKVNNILVSLSLSNNGIGKLGAQHISEALADNHGLKNLDLSLNQLGDVGSKFLAKGLEKNISLVALNVGTNNIGDGGAGHFAEAMKVNSTLSTFSLTGGPEVWIGNFGWKKLLEAFRLNLTITKFDFPPLRVSSEVRIEIEKCLKRNKEALRKEFFRTLESNEKLPWNRSRIMFVGQGRAGKTATVDSMLGKPFSPDWNSTIGASVSDGRTTLSRSAWKKIQMHMESTPKDHASMFAARLMNQKAVKKSKEALHRNATKATANGNKLFRNLKTVTRRLSRNRGISNGSTLRDIEEEEEENEADNHAEPNDPSGEVVREFNENYIINAGSNSMQLSLWDFGGQTVFYSMHHIFLTRSGIYVLAFSLLDFIKSRKNALSYLSFWLNSIKMHAPGAPIVLVGTFLDDIEDRKSLIDINDNLKEMANSITKEVIKNSADDLVYFPIDNKSRNGISSLKAIIEKTVSADSTVKLEVPMSWMLLLDDILSKRELVSYLQLSDIRETAERFGITSNQEVEEAIALFNNRGMIVHLDATETLRNLVIIKPQWLINRLSNLIRDDSLHKFDESEFDGVQLGEDLRKLFTTGLASLDLLEYIWDGEQVEFLLDLMERTLLLSQWKFDDESGYLIPSLLKGIYTDKVEGLRFTFDFSRGFLPYGVFQRLLCLLVGRISLEKSKNPEFHSRRPHIYKNYACLEYYQDNLVQVVEEMESKTITVYIESRPLASSCLSVIRAMLHKLNSDVMGTGLVWETKVENESDGQMISYETARESLLEPWFGGADDAAQAQGNIATTRMDLENFFEQLTI